MPLAWTTELEESVWFQRKARAPHGMPDREATLLPPPRWLGERLARYRAAWAEEEAGRDGRLVFEADAELGEEIRLAARARGLEPEVLAANLLARGLEHEARRVRAQAILESLTPREQQVTWRAARGQTNRQIAEALVISPETVKTHVAHVLEKLGVHSKADLRVLLLDLGVRRWEEGEDQ
jgi:DNA-binding CsgD family transcriptional regulator